MAHDFMDQVVGTQVVHQICEVKIYVGKKEQVPC